MNALPGFLMRIAKATSPREKGTGMMSIIIRRPYACLENELCSTFEGKEDVKVIVDRRYGERRTRTQSVESERRRADRRGSKEELVEVLLSALAKGLPQMIATQPSRNRDKRSLHIKQ